MKKFNFLFLLKYACTFAILVTFATACSNSTSGEEEDHAEPEGFVLKMNGQIIVEQLPGTTISGEFELLEGEETDLITIYFLDHDGDEFQPDEEELSLGFEFEDEGIAEFEQHAEDGKWSFHLHAETEGVTDLRLMLMHNDHSDFTTQNIHVHVETE